MRAERTEVTGASCSLLVARRVRARGGHALAAVLHLGERRAEGPRRPARPGWQVAWDGHALAHQPLDFFQANQFWPLHDTLAFSDALVGYAPAGLIGSGPRPRSRATTCSSCSPTRSRSPAPTCSRASSGSGPVGAAVAGAAFAFAPFRLEQDGHMHVISSGGIPLALALGLRGYRLRRPWLVLAGLAVAAWQLSLGFTLGLPLAYLLAGLGLIAAVVGCAAGAPRSPRPLVAATAGGPCCSPATAALLSRPYMRVADDHPRHRPHAGDGRELLRPGRRCSWSRRTRTRVWGGATAGLRDEPRERPREDAVPRASSRRARDRRARGRRATRARLRLGLGLGVLAVSVARARLPGRGRPAVAIPDRLRGAPGVDGIRVPGRLVTFSSLGLALLAGAGRRGGAACARASACARAAAPAALTARASPRGCSSSRSSVEGRGLPFDPLDDQAQPRASGRPTDLSAIPAPQLHLPAERPEDNRRYLLWSTDGFPEIVNGRSSLDPIVHRRT